MDEMGKIKVGVQVFDRRATCAHSMVALRYIPPHVRRVATYIITIKLGDHTGGAPFASGIAAIDNSKLLYIHEHNNCGMSPSDKRELRRMMIKNAEKIGATSSSKFVSGATLSVYL